MAAWKAGFQTANPDVTVNYDAVGSGGGREQFLAGGVQFAGSDAYLDRRGARPSAQDKCGARRRIRVPGLRQPDRRRLQPRRRRRAEPRRPPPWRRSSPARSPSGTTTRSPPTTPTPTCRTPTSRRCTARTSRVPRRTSPTTSPRSPVTTGPTVRSRPGRSRAARLPTVRPVSSPRSTEGEGAIGYADASQAADLGHANIGVGSEFVGPTPEAAAAILDESTPVVGSRRQRHRARHQPHHRGSRGLPDRARVVPHRLLDATPTRRRSTWSRASSPT